MSDIITSFDNLYHQVKDEGIYMVEDLHTAYWSQYEGGLKLPTTFVEFAKNKIDELNAIWTNGELPVSEFTKTTQSISCYDSIIVFEKRIQSKRMDIRTSII